MKLQIDLLHVASGPFFFASGKLRPDTYRFERVKGNEHIHRLTVDDVTGEKAETILKDLGLRLQQADHPVLFKIIVEDTDLDGSAAIVAARGEVSRLSQEIQTLQAELKAASKRQPAPAAAPSTGTPITPAQLEFLTERDAMLDLLIPHAKGEDTPLEVLKRIVEAHGKPIPPEQLPPPETTKPATPKRTPPKRQKNK